MLQKLEDFLHSVYSVVAAGLVVGAILGLFVGYGMRTVTSDKIVECGNSPVVRWLAEIEIAVAFGAARSDLEAPLAEAVKKGLLKPEEVKDIKTALDYSFAKERKNGAVLDYVADCLNGK